MSATDADVMMPARPAPMRRLIEGPSAWTGAEMRKRESEWTYRLSPSEVAEIEAALKAVRARGLDIADIRRDDFPLPTLGPVLERLRAEVLDGRGFVLLRGMPVEDRPIAESATAYWGVGTYFGSARSQNAKGHLLGHVYDLGGSSATDPTVRSYATAERQNFHIDRCDVVALLCLRRAKSGGLSAIVSSMALHNVMAERRPDLLERLYQPFPVDRRGEVPEGKAPFYEAPVFNEYAGTLSVLYSRLHIGSAQRFPEARRLTAEDFEALDMLGELAGDPELRLDMTFMPGDIQFLHNHTILHARTGYEDWPEVERKRHLLRLWLAPPGARATAAGVRRMLRRPHDRRPRRDHLQGHKAARTAGAGLNHPRLRKATQLPRSPPAMTRAAGGNARRRTVKLLAGWLFSGVE